MLCTGRWYFDGRIVRNTSGLLPAQWVMPQYGPILLRARGRYAGAGIVHGAPGVLFPGRHLHNAGSDLLRHRGRNARGYGHFLRSERRLLPH
jgi:hypothetical protein